MKVLAPLAANGKINAEAGIRDSQSTIINAPIQKVWAILADLKAWPEWNQDIKSVHLDTFEVGGTFKWNMNGTNITSTIRMIKEPELLSWTGSAFGVKAIHVWKLEETEADQTIITTDESIEGFLTLFFSHQKLHSTLLNWLSKLKQRAEGITA